jgi:predicted transcriptional regulator
VARKPIDPLGHETRTEILDMLADMQLTPNEMRGYLPAKPTPATVVYHLRILERADLVERIGGVYRLHA